MRILDAADVDALIEDQMVLDAIRELFSLPNGPKRMGWGRIDLAHPNGWLRSLPAFIVDKDLLGFKVLHQTAGVGMRYTVYVHRLGSGELVGMVDGLEVTNLRTGAVSAVATDHLAPENVEVAAIVGTGPIARGQLRALELVRPAARVNVFARTPGNRRTFVEEMSGLVSGRLVDSSTLQDALEGAELVTLATKATSPVFRAEHVRPGTHVNSVGPASRDRVEVEPAAFKSFDRVVCDSVGLVLDEAGDAHQAVTGGLFPAERAEELAAVVTGAVEGRTDPNEVTLFKSVGNGAQDLVVAARLLDIAADAGVGTIVGEVNAVKAIAQGAR